MGLSTSGLKLCHPAPRPAGRLAGEEEIWRTFKLNVRDGTEGTDPILADQQ